MIDLKFLKPIWAFCKKHATKLLAGLAIGSEAAAIYLTAKEAPIVQERLNALPPDATRWDRFKTAGKVYLPAAIMTAISMTSIVTGTVIGDKRQVMLESLCSASNAALAGYQKKVVDAIGKEKAAEIEDSVAQELMEQTPPPVNKVFATGKGDQLIFDPLSGRYFTSNLNEVVAAANRLNAQIITEMWVSVNEWYSELGLEDIGLGDSSGWSVDHFIDIPNDPKKFMTRMSEDGRSCAVISYYNRPIRYK